MVGLAGLLQPGGPAVGVLDFLCGCVCSSLYAAWLEICYLPILSSVICFFVSSQTVKNTNSATWTECFVVSSRWVEPNIWRALYLCFNLKLVCQTWNVNVLTYEPLIDFIHCLCTFRLAVRSRVWKIGSVSQWVCPSCGCAGLPCSPSWPRGASRQTWTGGCVGCRCCGDGLGCSSSWAWPFYRGADQKVFIHVTINLFTS